MAGSRILVALLFITGTLPATVIALFSALIGLPFFIAGIGDFAIGNVSFSAVFETPKSSHIALLWITGPLGLYGLFTLWSLSYLHFRNNPVGSRRNVISGLLAGTISGIQMLMIKFGLVFLLLPSLLYFSLILFRERKAER